MTKVNETAKPIERLNEKDYEFRLLDADEIECRVGQGGKDRMKWCSLLLYKDARCDMRRLDEKFGIYGWQRSHQLIDGNLFCTVSVYKDGMGWVSKQDVGTPSNTEAVKGQASDAFKRACFCLGIGRELYTSPKIFINLNPDTEYKQSGSKSLLKTSFAVSHIAYKNRNVSELIIVDQNDTIRYTYGLTNKQIEEWKKKQKDPNTNPIPAPGQDEALEEQKVFAYPQLQQAVIFEDVDKVWNGFPDLQNTHDFKIRCIFRKMEIAKTTDELKEIWQMYPDMHSNQRFVQKMTEFKNNLV